MAAVLVFLFFLLFVLLFGPIGYRAEGKAGEGAFFFQAKASWLFVILRLKAVYEESGFRWDVRLLGLPIFGSGERFLKKKRFKTKKRKAERERKKETEGKETNFPVGSPSSTKEQETKENKADFPIGDPLSTKEQEREAVFPAGEIPSMDTEKNRKEEPPFSGQWKNRWLQILDKLHRAIDRLKSAGEKLASLRSRLERAEETLASLGSKLERGEETLARTKEFWRREETQEAGARLLKDGRAILLHILPRHFHGKVQFGLDDPYLMGQILAVLGILLPLYQDSLTVAADFEEKKLAGDFYLKGRIIPGYVLLKGLFLLLDKKVRNTIKELKQLTGGN